MRWAEWIQYDETSPTCLRWSKKPCTHRYIGDPAGSKNKSAKYQQIRLCGGMWSTHRIIWELHNGPIPTGMEVDHINCDKHDNRISNLRLASVNSNAYNKRKYTNNRSGHKGVLKPVKGRWIASIKVQGKAIRLGRFDTPVEAAQARDAAALKYHGEFARS